MVCQIKHINSKTYIYTFFNVITIGSYLQTTKNDFEIWFFA